MVGYEFLRYEIMVIHAVGVTNDLDTRHTISF